MKKFLLAAVAASVALSPMAASVASAQGYSQERHTTTVKRNGDVVRKTVTRQSAPQYRTWRKGQRFDQRYARNYRQIDYRQYRGLRAPPRGYRYVQSDRNVILVSNGGIISQIFAGLIR